MTIGMIEHTCFYINFRLLFWSDWGSSPRIMKCSMSGISCDVLVGEDLIFPNGLVLDSSADRLLWVDAKLDRAESVRLDGTDRRVNKRCG